MSEMNDSYGRRPLTCDQVAWILTCLGYKAPANTPSEDELARTLSSVAVDGAIIKAVIPQAYQAIDDLLDVAGSSVPKELLIRCKSLLPPQYRNSFGRKKKENR